MTLNIHHKTVITGGALSARAIAALAVLLFILMQFAAVAHAAEHPFHEHDTYCDAAIAAEKNKADSSSASLPVCLLVLAEKLTADPVLRKTGDTIRAYLSRAPPTYIAIVDQ